MGDTPVNSDSRILSFATHEGFSLTASEWGDPEHPSVVFLHGGGQTRHSWGAAAGALAKKGWHTLSLDLRGHGDSGWSPEGNYELDHFVSDLQLVVASLRRLPVVVGASLGGITGLLAAGEAEETFCRALVLVDIAPHVEPAGVERIRDFMRANPDGFTTMEEAADAVAAYQHHRERPKDISGLAKNLRLKENGRYYWHWDPRFLALQPAPIGERALRMQKAAEGLKIPTLLVRGAQSDVVSEEGVEKFLQVVEGGKFVDVSGAGHMVAGDKNDIFTHAVVEFLDELPEE